MSYKGTTIENDHSGLVKMSVTDQHGKVTEFEDRLTDFASAERLASLIQAAYQIGVQDMKNKMLMSIND
jgi:uncharacterized membrane protein YukC